MELYPLSFGAGILAGVLYGLLNIRLPALPWVALVGLAGILIGEHAVPLVRDFLAGGLGGPWSFSVFNVFHQLAGRDVSPVVDIGEVNPGKTSPNSEHSHV